MSGVAGPGSPAPVGLLGVLRTWLQAWAGEEPHSVVEQGTAIVAHRPDLPAPTRVLVVDDNPVNLMVISAMLETRGLVPWLAADGAEAVALATELDFDLILMDLQMPVLDGLSATLAIRRLEACNSLPAVPVLAYSSALPAARLLSMHGISGTLAKPCGDRELEDCLLRWCPGYRSGPAMRLEPHGAAHPRSCAQSYRHGRSSQ